MKLKGYQEIVLKDLSAYLRSLASFRAKYDVIMKDVDVDGFEFDFPKMAWQKFRGSEYHSKKNGVGEPLPDIYLKVPTAGGKTFLACHAIDLINKSYLNRETGLVLWIVPSTQIYRQTINALKDRDHPYRQVLDISSGGRVLIREKMQAFNRSDVDSNLVILMLMLPSANRQNRETLKMFQDASGYVDFFPPEDDFTAQEELINFIPNLSLWSALGAELGAEAKEWTNQRQIQTSLGNTLRLLKPLVIMDEGHKAYGRLARETIQGFNPSFVLELSATPPAGSNKLVEITGKQLDEEEMIKLDIHLKNDPNRTWKETLTASYAMRNELEIKADEYRQNTDINIRPIALIQAERTGKDQIDGSHIHSEHVKKYLIEQCSVPESHIAIKTSEKDDLEGIDLLAADCPIRYIITKQALQEGWDCPFAYVLTILTNPQSATAITQLVGRILRQPYAKDTGLKELDECYIFTFQPDAGRIVREIKSGLEDEGMGDLAGRIAGDPGDDAVALPLRQLAFRDIFREFDGRIFLPSFAVRDDLGWRPVRFESDILAKVDWDSVKLDDVDNIVLEPKMDKVGELAIGYRGKKIKAEAETLANGGSLEIDEVFLSQQLADVVPNPWVCFDLGKNALNRLRTRYSNDKFIAGNFVFFVEELRKVLEKERERLCRSAFEKLLNDGEMFFYIIDGHKAINLDTHNTIRSAKRLRDGNDDELEKSLIDYVAIEDINDFERDFALRLEGEKKLLWWYRNIPRHDYFVQGWRRNRVFPDFLAAEKKESASNDLDRVLVLETKGAHLQNEDTEYKQAVFELCNAQDVMAVTGQLPAEPTACEYDFRVIFDKNWRNELNKIFQ